MCYCKMVKNIVDAEIDVIEKHIELHQWYNHIENKDEAIRDFVDKYAWLMREIYCNAVCNNDCSVSSKIIPYHARAISDGEIKEIVKIWHGNNKDLKVIDMELKLLKAHIDKHKWLNGISHYRDGVIDFLNRFHWVVEEFIN